MKKQGILLFWSISLSLLVFSCATTPQIPPLPDPTPAPEAQPEPEITLEPKGEPAASLPRIEDARWNLTWSYESDSARSPEEGTVWLALFPGNQPGLIGFGGVNKFIGEYSLDEESSKTGRIKFSQIASTKMAGRTLEYENIFFRNLSLTKGFIISGTSLEDAELVFFGGFGMEEIILARFSAIEKPLQDPEMNGTL